MDFEGDSALQRRQIRIGAGERARRRMTSGREITFSTLSARFSLLPTALHNELLPQTLDSSMAALALASKVAIISASRLQLPRGPRSSVSSQPAQDAV